MSALLVGDSGGSIAQVDDRVSMIARWGAMGFVIYGIPNYRKASWVFWSIAQVRGQSSKSHKLEKDGRKTADGGKPGITGLVPRTLSVFSEKPHCNYRFTDTLQSLRYGQ